MRLKDTNLDLTRGGGNFFKLAEGKTATVRFLYNKVEDIEDDGLLVHSLKKEDTGGNYNIEVLCAMKSDETRMEDCKWCASGKNPVGRYPLALYNEETKRIEYWSRTKSWTENNLMGVLANLIPSDKPVSGQIFTIIRTGNGTDTSYAVIPKTGTTNDGTLPNAFGEIKEPEERNCYRPTDYEPPVSGNGGATFSNGFNPPQSTRRTNQF